ncbi:MAG: SpoIIE family protein phosphatase [Acidobacteria bacterium]|nr:SpoIIE family protein phosphatase [Acidobacteriota bacterium]
MSRSTRLKLLALLLVLVAMVELRLTWSTIVFASWPESVHFRLPISDSLVVGPAEFGGLRKGDRVVEVDGIAVATRWQVHQQVIRRPMGAPVRVTVERGGIRKVVEAPSRSWQLGLPERLYTVMQDVVTPWFCILLGFFVVWRRPMDRMAWLVLVIMMGQANILAYLFFSDQWHAILSGALRLTNPMWQRAGEVAWIWFCYDFCAGRRLLPWLRWPLTVGIAYQGLQSGFEGLAGVHFPLWLPALQSARLPVWLWVGMAWFSMLLGFANLIYRLLGETAPDTRRRLRVLLTGMVLGRGPLLIVDIVGMLGRGITSLPVPVWVVALSMTFLVPLTFAYVLIVERAMDVGVVVRQGLQYAFARRGVDALRAVLAILPLTLVDNRWAAIGWSLLALLAVGPVVERLRDWIDRRFFREAVQAERVLADIGQQLRALTDPAEVLRAVAERVSAALHATEARTWLAQDSAAPPWVNTMPGDAMVLKVAGAAGLLGAVYLGPRKSQEPYSPAEQQLLESVAHQAALAMENAALARTVADEAAQRERIQRELEIAKDVQARLLPKRDVEIGGLVISGVCRPAQSIGGDSYDYIVLGDSNVLVTVADVAGKGVPAALLMSNLQAALRGLTSGGAYSGLAETLARLNELVFDSTPSNRFITFFAVAYEGGSRLLRYASAGHNPAALLRAGSERVEWIRTKGVALGLRRKGAFEEASLLLAPGDCLVLYTDGVTEAVNTNGEDFGETRLEQAMEQGRGLAAVTLRDSLVQAVDAFAGGAMQHDDITLVVLRAV